MRHLDIKADFTFQNTHGIEILPLIQFLEVGLSIKKSVKLKLFSHLRSSNRAYFFFGNQMRKFLRVNERSEDFL